MSYILLYCIAFLSIIIARQLYYIIGIRICILKFVKLYNKTLRQYKFYFRIANERYEDVEDGRDKEEFKKYRNEISKSAIIELKRTIENLLKCYEENFKRYQIYELDLLGRNLVEMLFQVRQWLWRNDSLY